ncbi:hypothetical protein Mx4_p68 [Myxococcus phage Mx4]|nr:hypothetical protein Mx4_p68 [Myxococcus phage Mx4]
MTLAETLVAVRSSVYTIWYAPDVTGPMATVETDRGFTIGHSGWAQPPVT